jgi:hypothetical protein
MNYEIVDQKAHLVRERVLGDCENCPARLQAMLLIRDLKFEKNRCNRHIPAWSIP